MKRNYKIILGFVVAIVLAISVIEAIGYIQSQRVHCSVSPKDSSCFCYENEVLGIKTEDDGTLTYICYTSEPPSPGFDLPIETWDEALEFVNFNFGTKVCYCGLKVDCERSDMLLLGPFSPIEPFTEVGVIPEELMTVPVELQCVHVLDYHDSGMPKSSLRVWGMRFFPSSGNIWERWCSPNYVYNCPDNIYPLSIINIFI